MATMLLAQLTDTHVLDPSSDEERWVDNNQRLAEAVAAPRVPRVAVGCQPWA